MTGRPRAERAGPFYQPTFGRPGAKFPQLGRIGPYAVLRSDSPTLTITRTGIKGAVHRQTAAVTPGSTPHSPIVATFAPALNKMALWSFRCLFWLLHRFGCLFRRLGLSRLVRRGGLGPSSRRNRRLL